MELYRKEAQRRSKIMKDRQVKPLDNAVYWVEYVIRHNGAQHLRVAYLDLTWYQYYLLDVFAFILVVLVGVYFALKKAISYWLRRIRKKKFKII
ncbi:hypothetical protein NQ314_011555 [Rhamnusium bicolor]|uniref:Uncharacterized protein n=1 Tax=Rhamnusium bicolor TaxID=1586634 RepID=A0AAV8XI67_9CUCU|nr:hypothetical protein NQ314_011555 [Rhamnusium bicolor]